MTDDRIAGDAAGEAAGREGESFAGDVEESLEGAGESLGGTDGAHPDERIAAVDAVRPGSSFLFTVRDRETDEEREALLVGFDPGEDAGTDGPTGGDAGTDGPTGGDAGTDGPTGGDAGTDGPTGGDAGRGRAAAENTVVVDPDHAVAAWINECQHFTHIRLDKGSGASMRDGEILCTNHGAMFRADTGECTYGPCQGAYLEGVSVTLRGKAVHLDDPDFEFLGAGPIDRDPLDLASKSNVEF